jgi:hypothetical protein
MDTTALRASVDSVKGKLLRWGAANRAPTSLITGWLEATLVRIEQISRSTYPARNELVGDLVQAVESIVRTSNAEPIRIKSIAAVVSATTWNTSLRHAALNQGRIAIPEDIITTILSIRFLVDTVEGLSPDVAREAGFPGNEGMVFLSTIRRIPERFDSFHSDEIREFNHAALGVGFQMSEARGEGETLAKKIAVLTAFLVRPEIAAKLR